MTCRWRFGAALWLMLSVGSAVANPADLDATFGGGGLVQTQITQNGAHVVDAAVQADGKIVVVGFAYRDDIAYVETILLRYNPDGTIDAHFGTDGIATATENGDIIPSSITLTADGGIVVCGYRYDNQNYYSGILIRYKGDTGELDEDFGIGGFVEASSSINEFFGSVLANADSTLLVTAWSYDLGGMVIRYTSTGQVDSTFGNDGILPTPFNVPGRMLAIGQDRILVTGETNSGDGVQSPALAKMDAAGVFDMSYGNGGVASVHADVDGNADYLAEVGIQHDGSVLVLLGNEYSTSYFEFARLTPDGQVDMDFGDSGFVSTDLGGGTEANSIDVLPDDRFVVGVSSSGLGGGLALVSYLANGSLDRSFGDDGVSVIGVNGATTIVVSQPDGKLVEAGWLWIGNTPVFATARHTGWADRVFADGFD